MKSLFQTTFPSNSKSISLKSSENEVSSSSTEEASYEESVPSVKSKSRTCACWFVSIAHI
eukprot:scaffold2688_cov157-Amphora_coffeaeformis.AAC.9